MAACHPSRVCGFFSDSSGKAHNVNWPSSPIGHKFHPSLVTTRILLLKDTSSLCSLFVIKESCPLLCADCVSHCTFPLSTTGLDHNGVQQTFPSEVIHIQRTIWGWTDSRKIRRTQCCLVCSDHCDHSESKYHLCLHQAWHSESFQPLRSRCSWACFTDGKFKFWAGTHVETGSPMT